MKGKQIRCEREPGWRNDWYTLIKTICVKRKDGSLVHLVRSESWHECGELKNSRSKVGPCDCEEVELTAKEKDAINRLRKR